jgi:hypothetical protein
MPDPGTNVLQTAGRIGVFVLVNHRLSKNPGHLGSTKSPRLGRILISIVRQSQRYIQVV